MALFNLNNPFRNGKKRGRIHIEQIQGDGFKDTNTDKQSSTGKGLVADANDFTDRKVNDPKGVLNRPIKDREYKKGYRYKEEEDGSLTMKGRRGNPVQNEGKLKRKKGYKKNKLRGNPAHPE